MEVPLRVLCPLVGTAFSIMSWKPQGLHGDSPRPTWDRHISPELPDQTCLLEPITYPTCVFIQPRTRLTKKGVEWGREECSRHRVTGPRVTRKMVYAPNERRWIWLDGWMVGWGSKCERWTIEIFGTYVRKAQAEKTGLTLRALNSFKDKSNMEDPSGNNVENDLNGSKIRIKRWLKRLS